jgi:membrane-associated phospholipid phosphatase
LDRRALAALHDVVGTELDDPARVVARTATAWVLVPVAAVATATLAVRRRWSAVLLVVAAMVLVWVVNPGVKRLVRRDRPSVRPFVEPVSEFSFPSGHATAAMAAAVVAVTLMWNTRWRTVALGVAGAYVVVIAASQLVLGVHFPSDVVAGCLLAPAFLAACVVGIRSRVRRVRTSRRPSC